MEDTYTASNGSRWHLANDCPPVPSRQVDWSATHDDYDGAPDAYDDRSMTGPTREAAIAAVEEWIEDNEPEPLNYEPEPAPEDFAGRPLRWGPFGYFRE